MSKTFTIRQGDRRPALAYNFGFSLVDAVGVTFSARDVAAGVVFIDHQPAQIADGVYTVNGAEQVLTPANGIVFYPWSATDTAVARQDVVGLFHILWPGNLQETMPSEGSIPIVIHSNF